MEGRDKDADLNEILDRFEGAWAAGEVPEILHYVPEDMAEVDRFQLLLELVSIDLERRWRQKSSSLASGPSGESISARPKTEEYISRYSHLGPLESVPVDVVASEYRVRRIWGDQPSHQEFVRRFPSLANELEKALNEVDAEVSIGQEITAPPSGPECDLTGHTNSSGQTSVLGSRVRYFGEYELLEEIARGGMGVVFKARQVKLNRIVALKMILSGDFAGEEEVQRFRVEAEAAASLDHPGIVPIFEIGEYEGRHYFSMAFVEGQSLAETAKDMAPPPQRAAEIMEKVAEAVEYAHRKGVIHRDLKPANILLDSTGEPRVTDFGLAKQIGSKRDLTRTGAVMGSPSYMPPEQASGNSTLVGPPADVYSMGSILYFLLTGRPPFHAANPMWNVVKVLEEEPLAPHLLSPGVPQDLETICMKCLQKDPNRRYHSAAEFRDELGRYLRGDPILARPVGNLERVWRWCKRNPLSAGLATTLALSLTIATIVTGYFAVTNHRMATESQRRADEYEELASQEKEARGLAEFRSYRSQLALARSTIASDLKLSSSTSSALHSNGPWEARVIADKFPEKWRPPEHVTVATVSDVSTKGTVAVAAGGGVYLLNVPSMEQVAVLSIPQQEHTQPIDGSSEISRVCVVAQSADGRFVVGVSQQFLHVWDTDDGTCRTLAHDYSNVATCRFSPDDGRFVLCEQSNLYVFNTDDWQQVGVLEGDDVFTSVAFNDDGTLFAAGDAFGQIEVATSSRCF